MKIPGTTMSPNPSIAKLLAEIPFSSKSWGKTTEKKMSSEMEDFGYRDCSH